MLQYYSTHNVSHSHCARNDKKYTYGKKWSQVTANLLPGFKPLKNSAHTLYSQDKLGVKREQYITKNFL